jgi:hypothetical protein
MHGDKVIVRMAVVVAKGVARSRWKMIMISQHTAVVVVKLR